MKHTFVICAYKESPYLEGCIRSLKRQTVASEIKIATSTPNEYIYKTALKYNIEVFENNLTVSRDISNISKDWQFAYSIADTRLVTVAHQDDYYLKDYTENLLKYQKKYPDMILFTTSSVTLKNGRIKEFGKVELIKKLLRLPLRINAMNHLQPVKRAAISLGNPIIAPSCTYNKTKCPKDLFMSEYRFALDWDCLLRLSGLPGRFVMMEKPGICYRVHGGSATKESIINHSRQREESEMFDRLLPGRLAKAYKKIYQCSYNAYD